MAVLTMTLGLTLVSKNALHSTSFSTAQTLQATQDTNQRQPVISSRKQHFVCSSYGGQDTGKSERSGDAGHARRSLLVLTGLTLAASATEGFALAEEAIAEDGVPESPAAVEVPARRPRGMSFYVVPKEDSEAIKSQYESMQWQCTGGMFDCDGDRREFAKSQMEEFAKKTEAASLFGGLLGGK